MRFEGRGKVVDGVVDPEMFFNLLAAKLPDDLRSHVLVVGSLAAAYHHRAELRSRGLEGVRTKDADVIIHPAGAVEECRKVAERLLSAGWRRTSECYPQLEAEPPDDLRAIRLYPPESELFFIELLALPERGQHQEKRWIPMRLKDGWYGLPSFRFLGVTMKRQVRLASSLSYAHPAMMALSNLLSHPEIGTTRIGKPIGGRSLLRSAKDLGRVLALAHLASREDTEEWSVWWEEALRDRFPADYAELASQVGAGLRALLSDSGALDEARHSADINLLAGLHVTAPQLAATGQRLLMDAIEPLEQRCRR